MTALWKRIMWMLKVKGMNNEYQLSQVCVKNTPRLFRFSVTLANDSYQSQRI